MKIAGRVQEGGRKNPQKKKLETNFGVVISLTEKLLNNNKRGTTPIFWSFPPEGRRGEKQRGGTFRYLKRKKKKKGGQRKTAFISTANKEGETETPWQWWGGGKKKRTDRFP